MDACPQEPLSHCRLSKRSSRHASRAMPIHPVCRFGGEEELKPRGVLDESVLLNGEREELEAVSTPQAPSS